MFWSEGAQKVRETTASRRAISQPVAIVPSFGADSRATLADFLEKREKNQTVSGHGFW
jgi:hypothetical protein